MKCPGNDILQAYIDGELEIGIRKNIENHLGDCDKCKNQLAALRENDDFVFTRLKNYRKHFEECSVPYSTQPAARHQKNNIYNKGVLNYMLKHKKLAAAACAALFVTACITIQPVRAAIENALAIFRVENMKGITITLDDMKQIQNQLANGKGEISLDKMGSIKMHGGESRALSKEDALNLPDFTVAFPAALSGEVPDINIVEPASIDFALNVKNVNQIMKSYGAKKLLPNNIEGKTFKVELSSQVTMHYNIKDSYITILQTKSPEITVPEGVNVDEVYNAVVDMPILPQNLQAQLKSIKDWKSTLYIPVVEPEMAEVDINGARGYMTKDYGDSEDAHENAVIWYDNGVIYAVSGRIDSGEILKIARSMK